VDVRIHDEALFVVPASGALWSYDFGSKQRVIREAQGVAEDPPFQVAQARAGAENLLLVFKTIGGAPSIADQHAVRGLLAEHVGNRGIAFVVAQGPGHVVLVGSDAELVEHFAAAAAVVCAVWGWDEANLFSVIVDEFEFTVGLEFDGNVWTAWPDPVSRGRALP
jgi:hypothetical protein